jgi:hypothetical protein
MKKRIKKSALLLLLKLLAVIPIMANDYEISIERRHFKDSDGKDRIFDCIVITSDSLLQLSEKDNFFVIKISQPSNDFGFKFMFAPITKFENGKVYGLFPTDVFQKFESDTIEIELFPTGSSTFMISGIYGHTSLKIFQISKSQFQLYEQTTFDYPLADSTWLRDSKNTYACSRGIYFYENSILNISIITLNYFGKKAKFIRLCMGNYVTKNCYSGPVNGIPINQYLFPPRDSFSIIENKPKNDIPIFSPRSKEQISIIIGNDTINSIFYDFDFDYFYGYFLVDTFENKKGKSTIYNSSGTIIIPDAKLAGINRKNIAINTNDNTPFADKNWYKLNKISK